MAGGNNLDINIRTKGADKARQNIVSVANTVDQQAEKINKKQSARENKSAKAAADTLKSTGGIGTTAIGTALGSAVTSSLSAANQSIAKSFDPNLSPIEKELALVNAGLDVLPFGAGEIPKALLAARTQESVGAARGTGARINQLLGAGFQGAADLSEDEFKARFEPQIQRLRKFIEPQERARERGSQLVAENLGSFKEELTKILADVSASGGISGAAGGVIEHFKKAIEGLPTIVRDLGQQFDILSEKLGDFTDGLADDIAGSAN